MHRQTHEIEAFHGLDLIPGSGASLPLSLTSKSMAQVVNPWDSLAIVVTCVAKSGFELAMCMKENVRTYSLGLQGLRFHHIPDLHADLYIVSISPVNRSDQTAAERWKTSQGQHSASAGDSDTR